MVWGKSEAQGHSCRAMSVAPKFPHHDAQEHLLPQSLEVFFLMAWDRTQDKGASSGSHLEGSQGCNPVSLEAQQCSEISASDTGASA